MKCFFKTVLIIGLVGVGTVALAHIVLGKARVHGSIKVLQGMAQSEVDKLIAGHNDMRQQLEALRAEYPRQIAVLRSQSAEVERQLAALERGEKRARDIVTLCDADLKEINGARPDTITAAISFRGGRYKPEQVEVLVERIEQTRGLYSGRIEDFEAERETLRDELTLINEQIASLRAEQEEFEVQYQSLLREIERISRNEQVIKLAESRSATPAGRHGETMNTLGQVKAALERARVEQEERLRAAKARPADLDYEARARAMEARHAREAKRATQPVPEKTEGGEQVAAPATEAEELEPVGAAK